MHSFVQVHFVISVFRELKAPKENAEVVIAISNILIKSSSAKGFDHSNALRGHGYASNLQVIRETKEHGKAVQLSIESSNFIGMDESQLKC